MIRTIKDWFNKPSMIQATITFCDGQREDRIFRGDSEINAIMEWASFVASNYDDDVKNIKIKYASIEK